MVTFSTGLCINLFGKDSCPAASRHCEICAQPLMYISCPYKEVAGINMCNKQAYTMVLLVSRAHGMILYMIYNPYSNT